MKRRPGYSSHSSRPRSRERAPGLGLSTVFGIVRQSGGNIWVYSELGQGTTFKIYLPRVDAEVDVRELPTLAPTTLRGTETILLVEDEEQSAYDRPKCSCAGKGTHVIPAQNAGRRCSSCGEACRNLIDLLLTDVVMPQMSGPELAKRLGGDAARDEGPFCMSGYTDDSIVRHGVLESGVAFIQKPITPALLTRKVREVLDADRTGVDGAGLRSSSGVAIALAGTRGNWASHSPRFVWVTRRCRLLDVRRVAGMPRCAESIASATEHSEWSRRAHPCAIDARAECVSIVACIWPVVWVFGGKRGNLGALDLGPSARHRTKPL